MDNSVNDAGKLFTQILKYMKLNPFFLPYTWVNSKKAEDLNMKEKTEKNLRRKCKEKNNFINKTQKA